tara:strand:+ start:1746 stop:3638 length:1893 start_codon:yes stop_codon:yes gene_type:complete
MKEETIIDQGKLYSLGELLCNGLKFRIPIYQRNYAWGETEIKRLLFDIMENTEDSYYLGTLVLYKQGSYYDVIDGQQRLTTLYLLLSWMQHFKNESSLIKDDLYFESRPRVKNFIERLNEKSTREETQTILESFDDLKSFTTALSIIDQFFNQDLKKEEHKVFFKKCLKKTYVFTTTLPEKTNVNHYFEIMNNRGEQLEKHEILKAQFLNQLDKSYNKKKYATVWDACSQMDNHVQYFFKPKIRKQLFGENFNSFPSDDIIEDFLKGQIEEGSKISNSPSGTNNGIYILGYHKIADNFKQDQVVNKTEMFTSIIDFENFLLQALRFMPDFEETNLEDKNLLKNFKYQSKDGDFPNAFDFIKILLQVRYLFDKYVIKREITEIEDSMQWSLLEYSVYDNTYKQTNTLTDETEQKRVIMLQSMFQVSYTANTNKTWLYTLMKYLFKTPSIKSEDIYNCLYDLMKERYQKSNFQKSQGVQTPRAVFNFLDFLLWLEYDEKIKNENSIDEGKDYLNKINGLRESFNKFKFTQRNSIEHFFPQAKINELFDDKHIGDEVKLQVINSFGNLCLISASSNSSYNKEHPFFKKEKGRSKNESLKQQIMFEMMDGKLWEPTQIEEHENEMCALLDLKLS